MSQPTGTHPYPVLFIHGLWIHASAWEPWQELFHAHGYTTSAPGWPGDADTVQATRDNPSPLDGVGIEAICRHYADLIDAMPVQAHRGRALLRRTDRPGAARQRLRHRRRGHRPGPDQGRQGAAVLPAAVGISRCWATRPTRSGPSR